VAGHADPTWCMLNAGLVARDLARFVLLLGQNGSSFIGQFASVCSVDGFVQEEPPYRPIRLLNVEAVAAGRSLHRGACGLLGALGG
jgi:hypothetical protein